MKRWHGAFLMGAACVLAVASLPACNSGTATQTTQTVTVTSRAEKNPESVPEPDQAAAASTGNSAAADTTGTTKDCASVDAMAAVQKAIETLDPLDGDWYKWSLIGEPEIPCTGLGYAVVSNFTSMVLGQDDQLLRADARVLYFVDGQPAGDSGLAYSVNVPEYDPQKMVVEQMTECLGPGLPVQVRNNMQLVVTPAGTGKVDIDRVDVGCWDHSGNGSMTHTVIGTEIPGQPEQLDGDNTKFVQDVSGKVRCRFQGHGAVGDFLAVCTVADKLSPAQLDFPGPEMPESVRFDQVIWGSGQKLTLGVSTDGAAAATGESDGKWKTLHPRQQLKFPQGPRCVGTDDGIGCFFGAQDVLLMTPNSMALIKHKQGR